MAISHFAVLGLPTPAVVPNYTTTPSSDPIPDLDAIKRAYRRALLRHHPDKNTLVKGASTNLTIDAVRLAYITLSNPESYHNYVYTSRLPNSTSVNSSTVDASGQSARPAGWTDDGIETVDLDQMAYYSFGTDGDNTEDEDISERMRAAAVEEQISGPAYVHPCRCGFPLGFLVTESELGEAIEDAEAEAEAETEIDGTHSRPQLSPVIEAAVGCRGCSLWIRVTFQAGPDNDDDV